ncbi:MAG: DNA adenine methylase [Oscillospiraceae bacterium]|nr:DNA adenine methylase [Oscillospiraceae bacterium]
MRFIGNKTHLLEHIKEVVDRHAAGASSFCDIFSGTASVARYFKQWYKVYSNDLLYFSYCLQRGTVENPNKPAFARLSSALGIAAPVQYLNEMPTGDMECLEQDKRFFQNNYAPAGGRMYITDSNALRIDFSRNAIEDWRHHGYLSDDEYFYLIASVIEGIPFVSNISGTYGAFNKTWDSRSKKPFALIDLPVIENGRSNLSFNRDGSALLREIAGDILYIDPPYNERQYLPNYHVLETAAKYDFPELRGITGQRPYEAQRSDFCSRRTVVGAFDALLSNANFQHIILSYNTDGIMTLDEIEQTMKRHGIPSTYEVNYIPYRRFKSRSAATKTGELKELLVYIQKEV